MGSSGLAFALRTRRATNQWIEDEKNLNCYIVAKIDEKGQVQSTSTYSIKRVCPDVHM